MADDTNNAKIARSDGQATSLAAAPRAVPLGQRLPVPLRRNATKTLHTNYAILLPDDRGVGHELRWDVVHERKLVLDGICPPADDIWVSAGFIYRCGSVVEPPLSQHLDHFADLCAAISDACTGWAVGLMVTTEPEQGSSPDCHAGVYALSRSAFVDARGTPPHLFELNFSHVGGDDEVRSQSAYGSDALTSPIAAVARLVQELAHRGHHLRPGDTVFSGSVTPAVAADIGGSYRVVSSSLGIATDFGVGF